MAGIGGRGSKELDKKADPARIDSGMFRSLMAVGATVLIVCLGLSTPLTANRALWFAVRWSLGGGVASTEAKARVSRGGTVVLMLKQRRNRGNTLPETAETTG